jgi:hypothetical protein
MLHGVDFITHAEGRVAHTTRFGSFWQRKTNGAQFIESVLAHGWIYLAHWYNNRRGLIRFDPSPLSKIQLN